MKTQDQLKSKCHNAEMRVEGDTTKYYVCTECEKACDQTQDQSIEELVTLAKDLIRADTIQESAKATIAFREGVVKALTTAQDIEIKRLRAVLRQHKTMMKTVIKQIEDVIE